MERIDKIISSQGKYSRKEVKKLVNKKRVVVDGKVIKKADFKVDLQSAKIYVDGEKICIKEHLYLILNKPKGYISATEDRRKKTVLDLVPENLYRDGLFPAGRLDIDTTGLMIITDDGVFAHNILSPRKHIKKIYEVTIDIETTDEMVESFSKGIKLSDCECKPAEMKITGKYKALVTLAEGRYHQIKRMFGCFGAKVVELNRIKMGNLSLPKDLSLGECRELTENELLMLQERVEKNSKNI